MKLLRSILFIIGLTALLASTAACEQIITSPAGEASLDEAGNVYFVHHFYKVDQMLEADIYVAYKK